MKGANRKRRHTVWFPLYDILETGKIIETLKRSVLARGSRGGRDEYRKGFLGSETTPYDPTMADTQRYTFAKTHRMSNTETEP